MVTYPGWFAGEKPAQVLKTLKDKLADMPWGDAPALKKAVDAMGKELALKGKDLYWPIRAALSGKTQGPDLGVTLAILGRERVLVRLESALSHC